MDDLGLALRLADLADALTLPAFQAGSPPAHAKGDGSFVSTVDIMVERELRDELARERPDDAVLGEEETNFGTAARLWLIDPIDHTNNFVRGIPMFATLLALRIDERNELGVVSAPGLGRRWWARRGWGAFTTPATALHVSRVDSLADAYTSFAALHVWAERGRVGGILDLARRCRFSYGSGGFWAHMLVAEGRLEASLDPWGQVWDVAPVQLIVAEAGGRVTDLAGVERVDGGCAVVTNGLLHDEILRLVGEGVADGSDPSG
jgi:histidinol-phosphatase